MTKLLQRLLALFRPRHPTEAELLQRQLDRKNVARAIARIERAANANGLDRDDARRVVREYNRLVREGRTMDDAVQAACNYAARCAPASQRDAGSTFR